MKRALLIALLLVGSTAVVVASGHRSEPVHVVGLGSYAGRYHPWPGPLFASYVGPVGVPHPQAPWPARTLILSDGPGFDRVSWAVPCEPESMREWYDAERALYVVAVSYEGACAAPDTLAFDPPL